MISWASSRTLTTGRGSPSLTSCPELSLLRAFTVAAGCTCVLLLFAHVYYPHPDRYVVAVYDLRESLYAVLKILLLDKPHNTYASDLLMDDLQKSAAFLVSMKD